MTFQASWEIFSCNDLDGQLPHIFYYVQAYVERVPWWSLIQDYVLGTDELIYI